MVKSIFSHAMLRAIAAVAVVLVAGASQAAASQVDGSFERTLSVTGPVDLSIRTGSGGIRVSPGSAATVRVTARIRADNSWFRSGDVEQRIRQIEQDPPIAQQGNVIRIGWFADEDLARNISISYDVTVPFSTTLDARTGSGSLDIGDITGPAEVRSGSGSLTIGRIGGALSATTGSGSIEVQGAAGLDARTGSGSIRATGVAGRTTARSGSGSIRIAQTGKGDVDVTASSGGVTVTGIDGAARVASSSGSISIDGRPSGPWSIHASSGTVTVGLPSDASFDLDARTNSGSIDSAHPVTVTGSIEKRTLQGKVRGGGPVITIRSSSGGVRIR